ncbi:unnamed protein product [Cylindrotheca closterium]|uniref:Uncharacterized protein n=1 Tax=Cylindrotheca closterium TaxID=2856 RepID=A0AAD2CKK4_9STRA|nr:unnamed protein product [Cylindrotheca closterium]
MPGFQVFTPSSTRGIQRMEKNVHLNYDLWCGEELPFLHDMVFKQGQAAYVALHGDFNATGVASLLMYGDSFAAISTSEGGAQNCTIFGSTEYDCSVGIEGLLPPISAHPSSSIPSNKRIDPSNTANQTDGSDAAGFAVGLLSPAFMSVLIGFLSFS